MAAVSEPRPLRRRGEWGRSVLEALLVLFAVAVFVLVAMERYTSSIRALNETALTVELANLRTAVIFYSTMKGRLPGSLSELVKEKVVATKRDIRGREYDIVIAGSYVESMEVDPSGRPLDPFGSPYDFDPRTGRVSSTTRGYETW